MPTEVFGTESWLAQPAAAVSQAPGDPLVAQRPEGAETRRRQAEDEVTVLEGQVLHAGPRSWR